MPSYSYPAAVTSFGPYLYWKLGEATGTGTAADASGNGRTGTYAGTYTRGVTGGTPDTSPNAAVTATTSTACVNTTSTTAISRAQRVHRGHLVQDHGRLHAAAAS